MNSAKNAPSFQPVDVDDMDGDGVPEIAIACSRLSALVAAGGRVLFTKPHKHSQHAVIGAVCPERKGKQVVFVDRGADGTAYCYNTSFYVGQQ